MAYVLFEEASCEGALSPSRKYRVILHASSSFKPVKSEYVAQKHTDGSDRWQWTKPFGDSIDVIRQFTKLPRQLMVTLHERGRIGHGPDVATYVLDCSSNCVSKSFVLSPMNENRQSSVTMHIIVTISGNPVNIRQDAEGGSTGVSQSGPPVTERGSERENRQAIPPIAYLENWNLQVAAETDLTGASASLAQVHPNLTQHLDLLPNSQTPRATDAVHGLASILANLEGIVKIADVLADVHPLVKGAWSLVNAAYSIARAQANLDQAIEALIKTMDDGCKLAKDYAPLKGRHSSTDSIAQEILKEVIIGASIIRVYCEKRPKRLSAFRTLSSNLAQEVDECSLVLSALGKKLLARTGIQAFAQIDHLVAMVDRSAADKDLDKIQFAEDANRALRNGSRGCLFGTRTDVIDAVVDWSVGANPRDDRPEYLDVLDPGSRVLFLCGVAGAGKSSIALSVAKAIRPMGLLGSMYSFQVAKQATLNPTNLFSTIARHLAEHDSFRKERLINITRETGSINPAPSSPNRKQRLIEIIRDSDPILRSTLSPSEQFDKFLLTLLALEQGQTAVVPTVIVIDAFDECGTIDGRRETLNILTRRAHELPASVRLIVTSRYDEDVQRALEPRPEGVCLLKMEQIPEDSTRRDIHAYVHDTLRHVRGLDSVKHIPKLTTLALAAERSFQWASTACLFIKNEDDGDGGVSPRLRLQQVLQSNEGLDPLYHTILDRKFGSAHPESLECLRTILGSLVCAQEPLSLRAIISLGTEASTDRDLEFDSDDYHHLAQKLSSLVTGTQELDTPLVSLHTSFTDFLRDSARSQKYHVEASHFHKRLATRCIELMEAKLQFNICDVPTSFKPNDQINNLKELIQSHIPDSLSYACRFWAAHVSNLSDWTGSEALRRAVTAFLSNHFLAWLEVMSLTGSSPVGALTDVQQIPSEYRGLSDLIHEAIQFSSYFAVPITQSAAHIYLTALPFIPTSSLLCGLRADFKNTVKVVSGGLFAWPKIRHILEGHTDAVSALAFGPAGHLIASGSGDGTIRFWDAAKGLPNGVLEGHSSAINSVAFSPDGSLLASGSDDKTIRIWNVLSRTAVGISLEGHMNAVTSVIFSPDGALIASGSYDNTIRIWNVLSRTTVGGPLEGHTDTVLSVVFSPDGALLATGSADCTIRIWDTKTWKVVGVPLEGHSERVNSVAFSPNGSFIASGSDDSTIRIWEVQSHTAVGEPLKGHTGFVRSVAFSPDGRFLASGSDDETIRVWDIQSRSIVGEPLEGHHDYLLSVSFSPDGTLIASSSYDRTLRIWDISSHSVAGERLERHSSHVRSVAFSPDRRLIVSGSFDSTIRIWDVGSRSAVGEPLRSHQGWVMSVAFSPDGALIATGSADRTIIVWDVRTWTSIGEALEGHTDAVLSVVFSPDGTLLATGSADRTIRIWDAKTWTIIGVPLEGHKDHVNSVAFSPDGSLIASGSGDRTVRIWDVRSHTAVGEPLEGHDGYVHSVAFSPDGVLIASASNDETIRVWNVISRAAIGAAMQGHSGAVMSVVFSPDGSLIASGSADLTIRMWDTRSRTAVGEPLVGHTDWVRSVIFSPDGTLIASGSDDCTIRIWGLCSQALTPNDSHSPKGAQQLASASSEALFSSNLRQSLADLNLSHSLIHRLQDGWILGPQRELVLWIPPSHRIGLGESRMLAVLGNPNMHNTILDFDTMACGSDWEKCRTGNLADQAIQY